MEEMYKGFPITRDGLINSLKNDLQNAFTRIAELERKNAELEAEIKKLDKRTSGSIRVGGFGCPIVDDEET